MDNIEDYKPFGSPPKSSPFCKVVNKDNTQVVCLPDGTVIPGQVWSRTQTGVNEIGTVIVKLLVNVE